MKPTISYWRTSVISELSGDLFEALDILLVFLFGAFTVITERSSEYLRRSVPGVQFYKQRRELGDELRRHALRRQIPITLGLIVLTWIMFPTAFRIVRTSSLQLWTFHPLPTLTVLICLAAIATGFVSILVTVRLFSKIRRLAETHGDGSGDKD